MKKTVTGINEKWVDDDGILWMRTLEGAHIDLKALQADASVNDELTEGKKALVLYDARNFFTITPEANEYLRSGILNESRIATAVVTDKLAVRLLVNGLNMFKKTGSPLKMFATEQAALKWLHSLKN
ncbi:MAG: DUF7793 family protein [Bacteroidia bacterium]